MSLAKHGLAFMAGLLSTLSPCVLPILPIVIGAAATQHRYGPAAVAGGLAISFVTTGLFIATIGFFIALDATVFRAFSALLLIAIGIVLLSAYLQEKVAGATSPLANWAGQRFGGGSGEGLWGWHRRAETFRRSHSPC